MPGETISLLTLGIFLIALLYSSVGHAGASGYLAIFSLFSLAPEIIKPLALALNIVVAAIATWQFWRAGHFKWTLFWPFALLSVPLAFLGGTIHLPTSLFKILLGIILLYSASRFFLRPPKEVEPVSPPRSIAIAVGGSIGLLSGLTGTGGGIFLTPLLLLMHWAKAKPAAAISALFILLNSIAGLLGNLHGTKTFPSGALPLFIAAALGGIIGSSLGSRHFNPTLIKRSLAIVLLIAGFKLILT